MEYVHYVWYIICNSPKFKYTIASSLTWPFLIVAFCRNVHVFNFVKSNVASMYSHASDVLQFYIYTICKSSLLIVTMRWMIKRWDERLAGTQLEAYTWRGHLKLCKILYTRKYSPLFYFHPFYPHREWTNLRLSIFYLLIYFNIAQLCLGKFKTEQNTG